MRRYMGGWGKGIYTTPSVEIGASYATYDKQPKGNSYYMFICAILVRRINSPIDAMMHGPLFLFLFFSDIDGSDT